MTKKELIEQLNKYDDDTIVVCADDKGMWDNINEVKKTSFAIIIEFGGGSPFSSDK